uniref:HAD family hydrolase n=1 Tax=Arhodomonas sp. AD133 TaxID=3415009 RepID=UPI003EBDF88A
AMKHWYADRPDLFHKKPRNRPGPDTYRYALRVLASRFRLGLVADIWAPRDSWIDELERTGVRSVFSAMSFSSDHGIVKPSPKPFRQVLAEMGADPAKTVMIGDSVRRDLGGATAAGLPCILVGGAMNRYALRAVDSLLDLL